MEKGNERQKYIGKDGVRALWDRTKKYAPLIPMRAATMAYARDVDGHLQYSILFSVPKGAIDCSNDDVVFTIYRKYKRYRTKINMIGGKWDDSVRITMRHHWARWNSVNLTSPIYTESVHPVETSNNDFDHSGIETDFFALDTQNAVVMVSAHSIDSDILGGFAEYVAKNLFGVYRPEEHGNYGVAGWRRKQGTSEVIPFDDGSDHVAYMTIGVTLGKKVWDEEQHKLRLYNLTNIVPFRVGFNIEEINSEDDMNGKNLRLSLNRSNEAYNI